MNSSEIDRDIRNCLNNLLEPELPNGVKFEKFNTLAHESIYEIPKPVRHLIIEEIKVDNYLLTLTEFEAVAINQKMIAVCQAVREDLYEKRKAIFKAEVKLLTQVLIKHLGSLPSGQIVILDNWQFTYTLTNFNAYDEECRLIICNCS